MKTKLIHEEIVRLLRERTALQKQVRLTSLHIEGIEAQILALDSTNETPDNTP